MLRRIQRRMQLQHVESLERYLEFLRDNRDEVRDLFDDLLITVTEFFAINMFECLEDKVHSGKSEGKTSNDRIRVWSVGCSTGEEAYSIAILLLEELSKTREERPLVGVCQLIFMNGRCPAAEGIYPLEISTNVLAEWLKRYFTKENDNRVRRKLARWWSFAPHNLLGDPPFSHLDPNRLPQRHDLPVTRCSA
ncbi:MAG: CheR family methyltransferase [Pirellulaceae bacterium]